MTIQEWLVTTPEPDARVVSVCCWDDYCVEPVQYRCACCGLTFCSNHTVEGSNLCIRCDDWCEREAMA